MFLSFASSIPQTISITHLKLSLSMPALSRVFSGLSVEAKAANLAYDRETAPPARAQIKRESTTELLWVCQPLGSQCHDSYSEFEIRKRRDDWIVMCYNLPKSAKKCIIPVIKILSEIPRILCRSRIYKVYSHGNMMGYGIKFRDFRTLIFCQFTCPTNNHGSFHDPNRSFDPNLKFRPSNKEQWGRSISQIMRWHPNIVCILSIDSSSLHHHHHHKTTTTTTTDGWTPCTYAPTPLRMSGRHPQQ